MKFKIYLMSFALTLVSYPLVASDANMSLSLSQAEKIALERDLVIQSQLSMSEAMTEKSVAADSWQDPVIKLGALAVPLDSFDLDQEPMTQIVIGYKQMLPRGDSAKIKSEKWLSKASLVDANKVTREAMLKKMVRKAWLKVYLKEGAFQIIKTNTELFKQLVTVSQSQYVAGRKKQQDVLQAEVEFSLIEDQLEKVESELQEARAALAQWVGVNNSELPLNTETDFLDDLMLSEQQMSNDLLMQHPNINQRDAMIMVAQKDVSLAKEKNSTQWGFDINYGLRQGEHPSGDDRSDFLSMMVMMSIPMFTEDKQDREIVASQLSLQAKRYQRQDTLRVLNSKLNQVKARWYKTIERISRYEEKVLPQAKLNSSAALAAYQSGVGSFIALTRARVSEFKAQLSHLKLTVVKANVLTEIRYLVGEEL